MLIKSFGLYITGYYRFSAGPTLGFIPIRGSDGLKSIIGKNLGKDLGVRATLIRQAESKLMSRVGTKVAVRIGTKFIPIVGQISIVGDVVYITYIYYEYSINYRHPRVIWRESNIDYIRHKKKG